MFSGAFGAAISGDAQLGAPVAFVPRLPPTATSRLLLSPPRLRADGAVALHLRVTLADALGNPVPGRGAL